MGRAGTGEPPAPEAVGGLSTRYVEALYADYVRDPNSVSSDWRRYFAALAMPAGGGGGDAPAAPSESHHAAAGTAAEGAEAIAASIRQDRVDQLVRAYRERGHLAAQIDPLGGPRPAPPELDPAFYGFGDADMNTVVSSGTVPGSDARTLRQLIDRLRNTYCRSIGVEYMHLDDEARSWLQERMEAGENRLYLDRQEQLRILTRLTDAVVFESFLREKYVGAKSFSLEGAETLIPLLDLAIEHAGSQGIEEIVMAMAHRGRLNVLANIMGKHPQDIFREFEDADPEQYIGRGDVKYHLGYSNDWTTGSGRRVHLSLAFNPSHLEFVNPVAMGRLRAKQDRSGLPTRGKRSMLLLIHGDAAFAGEGIVQETLNMSSLPAYTVGGALHVIVNNQIGFITPPEQGRSTLYATDVAKMLPSPVFHVNGEDPEAVAQVVRLAMDFRHRFGRDVFIDMYCYRRRGHNEGDEPSFTQPLMYAVIRNRPSVLDGYLQRLLGLGHIEAREAEAIADEGRARLERALQVARRADFRPTVQAYGGLWKGYTGGRDDGGDVGTGVPSDRLAALLTRLGHVPEGFHLHPRLRRLFDARREMATGRRPIDSAHAEALAFATLATEGHRIRMSGQDSERGTFSQRHAVLHDVQTGRTYVPLQHLEEGQAPVEIYNSPLSEAGVLGFEYGYSLDAPDALVVWEAQFGDFANAAQVIIDQFITSAEEKWNRLSGIVLLLPHGFEGQGPEHSSARLERFLLLAAEHNIQVAYPTTPAQYFHLLRRQVIRPWRKPLVVMTPKSLLRHRRAVSDLSALAAGSFRKVIGDDGPGSPEGVRTVIACTGKVYYDLLEAREARGRDDVALIRLEQLYPFPEEALREALGPYPAHLPIRWVQEEPANMGAWPYLRLCCGDTFAGRSWELVARPPSASPATGSSAAHRLEQQRLLDEALA